MIYNIFFKQDSKYYVQLPCGNEEGPFEYDVARTRQLALRAALTAVTPPPHSVIERTLVGFNIVYESLGITEKQATFLIDCYNFCRATQDD